jgi:hypothetical protein
MAGRIAMRHAVEHCLYRSKDNLFVLSRCATAEQTNIEANYQGVQTRSHRYAPERSLAESCPESALFCRGGLSDGNCL